MSNKELNVALIGCGYWGPNYVKNIQAMPSLRLKYIHDLNTSKAKSLRMEYPVEITEDLSKILKDDSLEAFIVATPARTHYGIARDALSSGKDVLVEKPITLNSGDALHLTNLAREKNRVLMVGHIFEYNAAFQDLKRRVQNNELGDIRYIHSQRLALGPVRTDAGALWDLASHDVYMTLSLLNRLPNKVNCTGTSFNKSVDDINNLSLSFPNGSFATIYANWHYPAKVRDFLVAGTKKAAIFDDIEVSAKIKIYDAGVDYDISKSDSDFGHFSAVVREGDILIPKIKINQPLEDQIKHFENCVRERAEPLSSGIKGYRNVKILETAEASRKQGATLDIKWIDLES